MSMDIDRKNFIKNHYSLFINAREHYGFTKYEKSLCNYICSYVPKGKMVLEVAMGTGYPFSDYLQKIGYKAYGIDISPELVEKCKQLYPEINCKIGDVENIEYPDNYFDCVCCFQSTWYFPNLNKAIDEMIRVTSDNGLIIFDVQNHHNKKINNNYKKNVFMNTTLIGKTYLYSKNIIKFILHKKTNWDFVVFETPTYPKNIYKHFKNKNITNFQVMTIKKDKSLEIQKVLNDFKEHDRLIFAIIKNNFESL